ncbi:MAG TPA: hypothetical protein VG756_30645 [Pseudonocardiaceae bacterium]|jgi:hypothetical protein|nr:hypothetical protein [Pseudonocardiaceae bacterium]
MTASTAVAGKPVLRGPSGPVPYIALWSAEKLPAPLVLQSSAGIRYADENLLDRDKDGVLWNRVQCRPGTGDPIYNQVHPLRQRKAMRNLWCQVCAGPADHHDDGTLWLLRDRRSDWPNWPEGIANTHPPVCARCARVSVRICPWLKPGFVAVRAHSTVTGVIGAIYRAGRVFPRPTDDDDTVRYGDPLLRWVRATQLVRELRDCTFVEL